jgi:hypothetical protein
VRTQTANQPLFAVEARPLDLLERMELDTCYPQVDSVIESVVRLCRSELAGLMAQRDESLRRHPRAGKLADEGLEVLSEIRIDLDARLRTMD